ncbi:MAG: hypothetical protein ACREBF_03500 [Candidatus Micrarchaeales archaeon]
MSFGNKIWNERIAKSALELNIDASVSNVLILAKNSMYSNAFQKDLVIVKSKTQRSINWVIAEYTDKEGLSELLSTLKRQDKSNALVDEEHFKLFLDYFPQEYRPITWIRVDRDDQGKLACNIDNANPHLRLKHMALSELMILEHLYSMQRQEEERAMNMQQISEIFVD